MVLGGLHLDCHENADKYLTTDLVMEAIQVIPTLPLQWVHPTKYKLYPWYGDCCQAQWYFLNYNNYRSSRHDCPVASLLQAIDNQVGCWDHLRSCEHFSPNTQYLLVRFVYDFAMETAGDNGI